MNTHIDFQFDMGYSYFSKFNFAVALQKPKHDFKLGIFFLSNFFKVLLEFAFLVFIPISVQCIVGEDSPEFIPVVSSFQATELTERIVWRDTVVATALHIQRRQISTETAGLRFE